MTSTGMAPQVDISIVIPSFNRGRQVKETVERCLALRPRPLEIVLVDDGSSEESASVLRSLASEGVRYIRMSSNQGQGAARSRGFAEAQGRYLVSLDDDSWLLESNALQKVVERFESLPRCGILAFRGFSPGIPVEPPGDRLMLVSDHITCGAAYRADVLRRTGYHFALLRFEGEEADLSLKVMNEGFDIVLDHSITFFHDYDPTARSRESLRRVRRLAVRNDLLRTWIYFPFEIALGVFFWRTISHLRWGWRTGMIGVTFLGYLGCLSMLPQAFVHRRPIRRKAARRYLSLRRHPQLLVDAR